MRLVQRLSIARLNFIGTIERKLDLNCWLINQLKVASLTLHLTLRSGLARSDESVAIRARDCASCFTSYVVGKFNVYVNLCLASLQR